MFKYILKFFLSLRTSIWLMWFIIAVLFAGAFIMPVKQEFQTIHAQPLFDWLKEQPLGITWWLWGAIGLLVFLTANTLFCSIESVIKKRRAAHWLLLISPQIIHIGFLFILLAHLLSSIGGFKGTAIAREGTILKMPNNVSMQVEKINISIDSLGYIRDWAVDIGYLSDNNIIKTDRIMPNKPSILEGMGVYVKDIQPYPFKAIMLEISREPGAIWALIGGILFALGTITLIILKMKREG